MRRSIANGLAPLNSSSNFLPSLLGSYNTNSLFFSFSIQLTSLGEGFPISFVIIASYSSSEAAGSNGFRIINSAKIHPTDHTSIAAVYFFHDKITSGALYHLVAIQSVNAVYYVYSYGISALASPKSQIFKSQFELTNKFLGFKSL